MIAHVPWGLSAADRMLAVFGCHIPTERLKREISVAVWNWEEKRGLPHYDGRSAQFNFGSLMRNRKPSHNGHKGHNENGK